jgi:5'-deoxynucleotidase YfbR-like HD superfamily hydrolase
LTHAHDATAHDIILSEHSSQLDAILAGGRVKRYHTVPLIGEQTVAAHSWGVAIILLRIASPSSALMAAALYHDVAEKWIGDCPADVKWREPAIKEVLDRAEAGVERELAICVSLTDHEKFLLSVADRLELMFFCLEQRRMGNRNTDLPFHRVNDWFQTPSIWNNLPKAACDLIFTLQEDMEKLS